MKDIQIEEIIKRASCLEKNNTEDKYNKSYSHFIRYFNNKNKLTEHDLIIGANFIYGWMPTILNFKSDEFDSAITILNKAKGKKRISEDELITLKKLINNSLVGTSKLLHFVNPDVYAIWDSRVCNFLTGKSYNYKVQSTDLFWSYLDLCKKIALDQEFLVIHQTYKQKINFEITPMRTIEQIMFICSKDPLR